MNRKGWPKTIMTMQNTKGLERGSCKLAVSNKYGLAAIQWCDTKVVNCISSYLDFGMKTCQRQVGTRKESFPCPSALRHYQENMGGVDKADQMRSHFGGFASVSHFKKWYKKTLMAVVDCMLLNGFHLWNMTAEKIQGRKRLKRHEYVQYVADALLNYKTKVFSSPAQTTVARARFAGTVTSHSTRHSSVQDDDDDGKEFTMSGNGHRCLVCSLEVAQYRRYVESTKKKEEAHGTATLSSMESKALAARSGMRRFVGCCTRCKRHAHCAIPSLLDRKLIHQFFPPNLSCMDILHSPTGQEIWKPVHNSSGVYVKTAVQHSHSIVQQLSKQVAAELGVSGIADSVVI